MAEFELEDTVQELHLGIFQYRANVTQALMLASMESKGLHLKMFILLRIALCEMNSQVNVQK